MPKNWMVLDFACVLAITAIISFADEVEKNVFTVFFNVLVLAN